MSDLAIVGGGVIGLSLAYEMASRGASVVLVDKCQPGRQASWAGAGVLPPTNEQTALHPLEQLRGMSSRIHVEWAERLRAETGIDNGFEKCGGVYLARSIGEVASLVGLADEWREFEIEVSELTKVELLERLPGLHDLPEDRLPRKAYWVPGEWQIRNPSHLSALKTACRQLGVKFIEDPQTVELEMVTSTVQGIKCDGVDIPASQTCVCVGAWTETFLEPFQIKIPTVPVRGQMVLFKLPVAPFRSVIYEGSRYIVPRRDGYVLAGATIEEVGFDNQTTDEGVEELVRFAQDWVPQLTIDELVESWAGLRPATNDSFPYMGRVGSIDNLFISTGHFKAGLHLSTGSAVVMADLLEKKTPTVDMSPFDPSRHVFANGC